MQLIVDHAVHHTVFGVCALFHVQYWQGYILHLEDENSLGAKLNQTPLLQPQ